MKIDTLQWWADVGIYKFPTLARIAIRILCAQPTSAETKRVFSVSGRVLNEARSRLTSSHVKQIVCLHSWLKEKHGKRGAGRNAKRVASSARFATLSLRLETEAAEDDLSDQDNQDYCYLNYQILGLWLDCALCACVDCAMLLWLWLCCCGSMLYCCLSLCYCGLLWL